MLSNSLNGASWLLYWQFSHRYTPDPHDSACNCTVSYALRRRVYGISAYRTLLIRKRGSPRFQASPFDVLTNRNLLSRLCSDGRFRHTIHLKGFAVRFTWLDLLYAVESTGQAYVGLRFPSLQMPMRLASFCLKHIRLCRTDLSVY